MYASFSLFFMKQTGAALNSAFLATQLTACQASLAADCWQIPCFTHHDFGVSSLSSSSSYRHLTNQIHGCHNLSATRVPAPGTAAGAAAAFKLRLRVKLIIMMMMRVVLVVPLNRDASTDLPADSDDVPPLTVAQA
jgi:hypothetical protein